MSLRITGSRDQLYQAWNAIANLADKAGNVSLNVSAASEEDFDQNWLRNAVYEPLEGADLLEGGETQALYLDNFQRLAGSQKLLEPGHLLSP